MQHLKTVQLTGLVHPMKYSREIFDGQMDFRIRFQIGFPVGPNTAATTSSQMTMVNRTFVGNNFSIGPSPPPLFSLLILNVLHFSCLTQIGLSAQDCVEVRRYFRIPPAIQPKPSIIPLTLTSYMWNDRDCNEKNYFLCERPLSDGK